MLAAVVCTMASPGMYRNGNRFYNTIDSIKSDSLTKAESTTTAIDDSIAAMIAAHNKAIDDSIQLDSLNRKKANGIDAPIEFSAKDSMVYFAGSKNAFFYGASNVNYENMDLTADRIGLSMDSSLVRAHGVSDSLGVKSGNPIFKMGSDTYESDTMAFNFKSKKGFINQVYTAQEDGFLTAQESKRDSLGNMYLKKGRYTTCDDDHPDFYIALSRAKVRPGKDVVFGPAYLVVADVPLPLAIPYGFFPFSKSYSSGFIMPTYGDETARGFYLRDGGYYFAINDKMDLKLIGEIYTKGSWGVSAASNYRKRYKYSGSFLFSYQDTKNGEKGMPDFMEQTSFKLQWSHRQDAKANPFNQLSASINFATSSYEKNNLTSMYNPQTMTQSLRTSSMSWSTTFSSIGLSLSSSANLSQNMRDTTIAVTLPDLNISLSRFYPFRRKHAVGKERWYEKISMSYTGHISNSITTKEDLFFKSSLVKDWRNGMQHNIPISGNFNILNYINVSPSINFTDRTYLTRIKKGWDAEKQQETETTETGFYNVYNFNASLSASTKLYGFYIPNRKIFGDKIDRIRHVLTPRVTFSYAPDCGSWFLDTYQVTDKDGNVVMKDGKEFLQEYSPYQNGLYGAPGRGKSGSIQFDLSNNIEMKVKQEGDSVDYKKISLIDELGLSTSYNMMAKERPWSDLNMRLRLKLTKSYTFNLNAIFATYAYIMGENKRPVISNNTEYSYGRMGRFQGISQNISYTLNPEKLRKLFYGSKDSDKKKSDDDDDDDDDDTGVDTNVDDVMEKGKRASSGGGSGTAETDDDGYMLFKMPWSLTFGYGISMREDLSNFSERPDGSVKFGYKFTQTLNMSGNLQISDGWNISFTSGYDFEGKKISMTSASLSRDLHCFNMSASIVLAPYTSYNFSFRCNAATLTDALKYDKRSGYTNAVQWY